MTELWNGVGEKILAITLFAISHSSFENGATVWAIGENGVQGIIREEERKEEDETNSVPADGGSSGMDMVVRAKKSVTRTQNWLIASGNQMKSKSYRRLARK
jgi:hypothetical protein